MRNIVEESFEITWEDFKVYKATSTEELNIANEFVMMVDVEVIVLDEVTLNGLIYAHDGTYMIEYRSAVSFFEAMEDVIRNYYKDKSYVTDIEINQHLIHGPRFFEAFFLESWVYDVSIFGNGDIAFFDGEDAYIVRSSVWKRIYLDKDENSEFLENMGYYDYYMDY